MRTLVESTDIPRLWDVFSHIIGIGGVSENGFNLMGFSAFALGCSDLGVDITHEHFWQIMRFFLNERNNDFAQRLKRRRPSGK